ncbi:hypothetical protein GCM10009093_14420 [Brevundimonas terrae]|uniref:Uncharacterized protein n=1 Tax=Brevundimonas terrae TaxID=363631 RepID=A0ABP3I5L0_9CAUL
MVAIDKGACLSGGSIGRLLVSLPYSPMLVLDIEATDIEATTKTLSGYEEYMVSLLPAAPIPVKGQGGAVYACHEELCRAVFGLDGHALMVEWHNRQLSPTDAVQATMSLFREWTAPCAVAINA